MELNHLQSFIAVAKLGHLTRAAETLHLSQPALSGQIKALEENLGVTLFERSSSGMSLTTSGRRLLEDAQRVIEAVQQLNHAAQRLRGLTTGTIKIGTVLDPSILQVGELLSLAFERHPQLELELHQVLSSDALVGVRNGTLDASFYFGHRPEADLDAVALREIIYRVAIPIAWADELMSAPWEVVAERPWIITPEHSSHRALVMELFHDRSALPARLIEADNEPVIINLVESQVGVSLVREELASASSKAGLRSGRVRARPPSCGWFMTPNEMPIRCCKPCWRCSTRSGLARAKSRCLRPTAHSGQLLRHPVTARNQDSRRRGRHYGRRAIQRVELAHKLDVFLRFRKGRNALLVMLHCLFAGVVRRQREAEVVGEERQQIAQIARADRKIDRWIKELLFRGPFLVRHDTIASAGIRGELHQS
jgi:DNA-binding transcriptional LysR family regulator